MHPTTLAAFNLNTSLVEVVKYSTCVGAKIKLPPLNCPRSGKTKRYPNCKHRECALCEASGTLQSKTSLAAMLAFKT